MPLASPPTRVLTTFARSMVAGVAPSPPPVTLVHGVFGAGKSYLLAAIALFVTRAAPLFAAAGAAVKVLIASSTNVAGAPAAPHGPPQKGWT